ncbi:hypothetical protein [Streptomyces sp. NPDC014006]|uniref:hypothetical protein n=1 Tax=Streptomyces sp. NPDC014006 TaxID=3364870 RepID=UPI0036F83AF6
MTTTATEATDPDDVIYDAEIVDDEQLLPAAPADAPVRYRITRTHDPSSPRESCRRAPTGNRPFTEKDFTVPPA